MAVEKGLESFEGKDNQVIIAPTASGKSLITAGIAHALDKPTLILQPSKEILEQNYSKLLSYGVDDISMYSASVGTKEISKYTFATIGSIYKLPAVFKHFKHIIVDEADLANNKGKGMYKTFFKGLDKPKILGLTATPYRIVQRFYQEGGHMYYTAMLRLLNHIHPPLFKGFSFRITNKTLFDKKYLAPIEYIYNKDTDIDISKIKINTTGADFDDRAAEEYLLLPDNIRKVVEAIISLDHLPNTLTFCRSIKQARSIGEELAKLGYDSDLVTGKDPDDVREYKISRFRSAKTKTMLNVGVLSVGFDYPGLYGIILGCMTMSLRRYYQWVGRGVRLDPFNPNKVCTVLDCCNNVKRMGRIETIRVAKDQYGRDFVETERGQINDKPLFTFKVNDPNKIQMFSK